MFSVVLFLAFVALNIAVPRYGGEPLQIPTNFLQQGATLLILQAVCHSGSDKTFNEEIHLFRAKRQLAYSDVISYMGLLMFGVFIFLLALFGACRGCYIVV